MAQSADPVFTCGVDSGNNCARSDPASHPPLPTPLLAPSSSSNLDFARAATSAGVGGAASGRKDRALPGNLQFALEQKVNSRVPILGLHTAMKPLFSHSTTGEFNSPPAYLRAISTARTLST
eukprot:1181783-Prorocentrum_minimum.AAC.2